MLADTVFLIKDNNVTRCGEKNTDKADASHHFILLQSHSKTERVVQSAEFLLSLRSPRRKRGGPLCRLISFRSLTEDRTGGKGRKGKERKGKERFNALHSQMATPTASFVQSSSY